MAGLTAQDKKALDLFSAQVKAKFADRVEQMQLFGSKARGDATKFSHVDVLMILRDATRLDRWQVSKIASDIFSETDNWLSPHNDMARTF